MYQNYRQTQIKQNICKAIPSTTTEEYFYTSIVA